MMMSLLRGCVVALVAGAAAGCDSDLDSPAGPSPDGAVEDGVAITGYVLEYEPGMAIGGETEPRGWIISRSACQRGFDIHRFAYIEPAPHVTLDIGSYRGQHCEVRGSFASDPLVAGGTETPRRTFRLLHVKQLDVVPRADLQAALRDDLRKRGHNPGSDGRRNAPEGGLTKNGTCADGRAAQVVVLSDDGPDVADGMSEAAYVCADCGCYWTHVTGGFAGFDLWYGPFDVPDLPSPD